MPAMHRSPVVAPLSIVLLVVCFVPHLYAGVLEVPASFATIQLAIDSSFDGDEIVVAPGTYPESIDFQGKSIVVRSSAGADVTIIDAGRLNFEGEEKVASAAAEIDQIAA